MGLHRRATERDKMPLNAAARTCDCLNRTEQQVPENLRWTFELKADRREPDKAVVIAYDEKHNYQGVWCN